MSLRNESIEDYIKAIYLLERDIGLVSTNDLAQLVGVSAASASAMLKKLAKDGQLEYQKYYGAKLTEAGRKQALKLIRRHNLIEVLLRDTFQVPIDRVDEEAHKLEHAISDYMEDRIAEYLGEPSTCPHGSPIPSKDGKLPVHTNVPLPALQMGKPSIIAEIKTNDSSLLRYFDESGILPGNRIEKLAGGNQDQFFKILVKDQELVIGAEIAQKIMIKNGINHE